MKKFVTVSPSQIETFLRCPRLWWFTKVCGMKTLDKGYGHFGTVLHGVVERWIEADGGRDPTTGDRVNLFPDGWHIARNKFTNEVDGILGIDDQRQIKRVVREAIEKGYVMRWPGAKLEHRMKRQVIPGITTHAYIDVLLPNGILDHKSTSDMKWAKSRAGISHDIQLLFYAREVIERDPDLDRIRIGHIYYAKKPTGKQTKLVETYIDQDDIFSWWDLIRNTVRAMQEIHALTPNEPWNEVQGPENTAKACNAYGGCDFRTICARRESMPRYTRRIDKIIQQTQADLKRQLKHGSQKEHSETQHPQGQGRRAGRRRRRSRHLR